MLSLAVSAGLLLVGRPALAAPATPPDAPTWLVVARFSDAAHRDRALASRGGVRLRGVGSTGFEVVQVAGASADEAAASLAAEPGVLSSEPDGVVRLRFAPNDTYWLSDPITGFGEWGVRKVQADRAWDVVRGSSGVTVATVDTGVDPTHPELSGALVAGGRFVNAPDPSCAADTTNRDDNGHGTHVAGLIAAAGNNGAGIAGVAFGVKLMAVKALDCTGTGLVDDIATSITYAVDHGARVVNVSLGSTTPAASLQAAVDYATAHNALVVAAAGNCGILVAENAGSCPSLNAPDYPAAYPGVLAVGATDQNDQPASFSTAAPYVGVAAPGTQILSTFPTYHVRLNDSGYPQNYAALRGTSQSSPIVAGVAALVLSKDPSLTGAKVMALIRSTADDVYSTGWDAKTGDGRVNAYRAVTAPTVFRFGATYAFGSPAPATLAAGTSTTLRVTATNTSNFPWPAGGTTPVHLSSHWFDASGALVLWDGPRASFPADVPIGSSASADLIVAAPAAKGVYTLRVDLVQEGVAWFSAQGVATATLPIVVNSGLAATYQPAAQTLALVLGTSPAPLTVTLVNTGTRLWPAAGANPVRLAAHLRDANGKVLLWDGPRATLPGDVAPGGSATVTLVPPTPAGAGAYLLELDLVQEGVTWFSSEGVATRTVPISATSGYGVRYALPPATPALPGGRIRLAATLTNSGVVPWTAAGDAPVHAAYHLVDANGNPVVWDGTRTAFAADVAAGATANVSLVVDAPLAQGAYTLRVDLVREGVAWFSSLGAAPLDVPFLVTADRRANLSFAAGAVSRSLPQPIAVTVANTSGVVIASEGALPVDVATHWLAPDGTPVLWDGPRAALPKALLPGDSVVVQVPLAVPPAGAVTLVVDLVQEGAAWYGAGAAHTMTFVP